MKRRIEDQILLLAYDELDASEAQALFQRIEADPALRALYEEHLRIRRATRGVPVPPAPLLSSERLRERILSESFARRKGGWGWMSLGAGAALAGAFAYLMFIAPTDSRDDNALTQRPGLTVALNDLPAPHEWVPALIGDIDAEAAPISPTGQTGRTGRTGQVRTPEASIARPAHEASIAGPAQDATKGAMEQGDPEAEPPTVVVIGANGRAVEVEGTDGVAFGG
jgi:hypothetical protein